MGQGWELDGGKENKGKQGYVAGSETQGQNVKRTDDNHNSSSGGSHWKQEQTLRQGKEVCKFLQWKRPL